LKDLPAEWDFEPPDNVNSGRIIYFFNAQTTMLKQLYLFRHADATEKSTHQTDKERELSSAGKQQALQIGNHFVEKAFTFDLVFSSTAIRAKQTTTLATQKLKIDPEKIFYDDALYDASVRTLFEYIHKLDNDFNHVLFVGHNPTLSHLTEYLTRGKITGMPTAAVAALEFNITSWKDVGQENGELFHYIHPELKEKNS
jgi:phosphohistidine phosphatase